ncbi:MAG: flagellar motor protein MotB [Paracoccaceae bacterium]|jgi:chemotaxis protein MotB|nr:flagellar motor protein MotB [Paracoccaceae bacterium]MDP7185075.1 flagellar motor protein MotB [Paracoccaceae bacterium]
MSAQSNAAPVIIKRKKVVEAGGHHGGAWKVAYADFVTAMMAFFMLMWLLNATTEQQRKGIADYFNPTIPVNRISGGGDGSFGGDSVFSEEVLPQMGMGASNRYPTEARQARGAQGASVEGAAREDGESNDALNALEERLLGRSGESMVDDNVFRQIITRVTDEGLVIELFALEGSPLFLADGVTPAPILRDMAVVLAHNLRSLTNDLAVGAHVRARPIVLQNNPVWKESTAKADVMRELLGANGSDPKRFRKVTGFGDSRPNNFNPMSIRNNRIEVIVLRSGGDS